MCDGVVCCPGEGYESRVVLQFCYGRGSPCTLPAEVAAGLLWRWQMHALLASDQMHWNCWGSTALPLPDGRLGDGGGAWGLAAVLPSPVPCVSTDGFDSEVP
jgi:hypothetical protein